MSEKRKALGRGLQALIPEVDLREEKDLRELATHQIQPSRFQPRSEFEPEALAELAASVAAHGVVQPLIVRTSGDGYELVAGERRWRAAQMAGMEKVPVVIRDVPDEKMLQLALVENLQRENLNPLEEAAAFRQLIDDHRMTQEDLAEAVGKSRSHVANTLRLLALSNEIQVMIRKGLLSAGHARALLALQNHGERIEIARRIVRKGTSVRETEGLVRKLTGALVAKNRSRDKDPALKELEERLSLKFGARVRVSGTNRKGWFRIEYFSEEDMNRILASLDPDRE
ncbi:MAG: ParB/RepB/Spo0J family partition protein [Chloroflexi bacterium]|nr:ParB/RepB/Spo0J family partition protein [Chloroflexota bacterium]